ncbi:MAG: transglutaminase domain-containing protein [Thermosynechococcaceae cyanobacterium]
MPQNLEQQFRVASQQLRQRQRKQQMLKGGVISFVAAILIGVIVFLRQSDAILQLGVVSISTINLANLFSFLILLGLIFLAVRTSSTPILSLKGRFRPQYLVGFFLLGIALVFQWEPRMITNPINGTITQFLHQPQPPAVSSPWPWPATVHPSIATIPAQIESSIDSVAKYIIKQEPDPTLRLKAAHDYVLKRLTYDKAVLTTGIRPPQDAQTVFRTGNAVCEGYAKLFQALGKAMGAEVVYVRGDVRRDFAPTDIIPTQLRLKDLDYNWTYHAWNAVKVKGNWQLVDTTWDDSDRNNDYQADYLMLPPEAMISSHFPDLSSWQLLDQPISQRNFEGSPILSPQFFAEQLTLVSPTQYQTKTQQAASIQIQQPSDYANAIVADFEKVKQKESSFWDVLPTKKSSSSDISPCQSEVKGQDTTLSCSFPAPGTYQVFMFSQGQQSQPLGQLKFEVS